MLLALRSLWEQTPLAPALGGVWGGPRVNFAEFIKLDEFLKVAKITRRPVPDLAIALFAGGQIDVTTFAALLAASQE